MELEFRETAIGPCIVCGKESRGSMYWLGMSANHWAIIRPFVEEMTPISPHSGVKLVLNILFWPQLCKPLCGPICSARHKEMTDEFTVAL